ncbi:MAG: glycosyltransferase family 2 protein [Candidatus Riesia sp.]|nr:glycosyltransferase family 2 protein [Candidatus Riesia sp.]
MKYSIVIPVYLHKADHKQVVEETLQNIKSMMPEDSELIIVDDGSPEMTGFLRNYSDTYVRQPNQGIGRSWEVGRLLAQGEYVLFANDDIKLPPGALETLANGFNDEKAGVVAPRLGHFTTKPLNDPQGEYYYDKVFYPGYCFMLKRDRFYEEHDARFKTNCGDVDYWERIIRAGYGLLRAPLEIWHKEGGVLKEMDYDKLTNDSIQLFKLKHGFDPIPEYYAK